VSLAEKLIYRRSSRLARVLLGLFYGIECPNAVKIGARLKLVHHGRGTVIYPRTTIGNDVRIYHQVTLGRKDAHVPIECSRMERLVIEDHVVIFPGAKLLAGDGITRIREGTIVAANAVVIGSTGANEIWAGVPARRVGVREG
jgi:serine O-acetyltransferase